MSEVFLYLAFKLLKCPVPSLEGYQNVKPNLSGWAFNLVFIYIGESSAWVEIGLLLTPRNTVNVLFPVVTFVTKNSSLSIAITRPSVTV